MSEQSKKRRQSFWRNASRKLSIYGIPAPMFLIYLAWCRWPSMMTLYVCTAIMVFFLVLSHYGWTVSVLLQRAVHLVRGCKVSGRPWWFRRFYD